VGHQPRFAYVSFHDMRPGQAASTHVLGLYGALRERGWQGPLLAGSVDGESRLGAKLARYMSVLLRARQQLGSVELLYVRAHPVALPLVRAARRRGVPVMLEVNGTSCDLVRAYPGARLVGGLLTGLDRSLVRAATHVVTVSDALARHLVSLAPGVPVVVIPNAADPAIFRPEATTALPLPRPYVAFCGALTEWQGVEVMLSATRSAAWPSDVSLVIAGDGPLAPRVAESARGRPVVAYLGVVPQREVGGILAGSLAGLSPNTRRRHAGDAVKLWEAVASGVPVVASDVEGQCKLVARDGLGLVYPAEDADALAQAVRRLARDAVLRSEIARRVADKAAANTWQARAASVERVAVELIAGHGQVE
jgi:glycosyltransferase involved in cell wall biosynthesis